MQQQEAEEEGQHRSPHGCSGGWRQGGPGGSLYGGATG